MTIWTYEDDAPEPNEDSVRSASCIFCTSKLEELKEEVDDYLYGTVAKRVKVCLACGWWVVSRTSQSLEGQEATFSLDGAYAHLRNLDLTNITEPLEEIRRYLTAKYKDIRDVH